MAVAEIDRLFADLERSLEQSKALSWEEGLYIYGAGGAGRDMARLLQAQGVKVRAFLDRNARPGEHGEGIPIMRPDEPSREVRAGARVAMGIFNYATEMSPILDLLRDLGYGKIVSFPELHEALGDKDRYWLTSRRFYLGRQEEVQAGAAIWSDEASLRAYLDVLRFRFTRDYAAMPACDRENQYFPQDLPRWPEPVRFVDCGACDGDTLRDILARGLELEAFAAFEPDPENFRRLEATVRANRSQLPEEVKLLCAGVGGGPGELTFRAGQGAASHASTQGDITVPIVTLDEKLAGFRPTVIKMDIEGAEPEALQGARQLIEEHRPGLAISIYHLPEHLWMIPRMIQSWLPGGTHHLRVHGYNNFDVIYYWRP